jgi:adenylate cyclase
MSFKPNGELAPSGGGDKIPLIREKLSLGRRETCDIPLRFPNISGLHAELTFRNGYWYIRDCGSTNGVKVNGMRITEKMLHPKDRITIGKRDWFIKYDLPADMVGRLEEAVEEDVMATSLLEKAGLEKPRRDGEGRGKRSGGFDAADFLLSED